MYKTVRQGENSLQYTILPQTEEVLINSGVKGRGRDYSPSSHSIKISRKLVLYYVAIVIFSLLLTIGTLFFVLVFCGLVPGGMDPPIHKSFKPETSALKSSNRFTTTTVTPDKSLTKKKELVTDLKLLKVINTSLVKMDMENNNNITERYENVAVSTIISTLPPSSAPTTTREWVLPAIRRLQSTTVTPNPITEAQEVSTIKPIEKVSSPYSRQRESNADLMLGHDQNNWTDYDDDDDEDYDLTKLTTETLATTKPLLNLNNVANQIKSTESSIKATTVVSGLKKHNKTALKIKSDKYMEMKEHILDDDDEEYKEPLTDEEDITEQSGSDDVKMSQAKGSWLQTRWPFVDPSSYFQWTGYSARDNLLLPAILSAALSALLVLAILCYALRRRQRCKRRIQEIGNLTSDLQAEDNAILLTAENPSEED